MISILIPIYNYDISNLALEINAQCKVAGVDFEIVCFDDCSNPKFKELNRVLDHEFGISYLELSDNLGRSKIRNKLAKNARYEHLLFLDCDSGIINDQFVQNYLDQIGKSQIVYGGRIYETTPPKTVNKMLHWKYGSKRESQAIVSRKKQPFLSFQSNNFLIQRKLMLELPFPESISGYGYEDLVFAYQVKRKGVLIHHIENPVLHRNVENNKDFIRKTGIAAENLASLYHQDKLSDTRMLKFYEKVENVGFNSFLHKIIQGNTDRFLKNLNSQKPNLRFFDLYRYGIFLTKLNELKASSS